MKNILLSTVALVAFAGAAAADVSWSGAATLGYNDDLEDGVYADVDIDIALSQELNNGWTAAAKFGFELVDGGGATLDNGNFSEDNNIVISLTNDMYGLYLGDVAFAAETHWSGVTNMAEDGFSEADGETALRFDATFGAISASLSGVLDSDRADFDTDGDDDTTSVGFTAGTPTGDLEQLALGVSGDLGAVSFTAVYQAEWEGSTQSDNTAGGGAVVSAFDNGDFSEDEMFGLSGSMAFSGADVTLAYAKNNTSGESSTGAEVSYPMGAVTLGAFYVSESASDDNYGATVAYAEGDLSVKAWVHDGNDEDYGVNIAYAMGDWGLYVGGSDDDGAYVAGELDLGGGASFTVSYANDEDSSDNDEIGPQEYLQGTTLAVSLSF
jgi:outer membrane protein OmpU